MGPADADVDVRIRAAYLRRWTAFWLFIGFSAVYIALTRGHFISTDEISVYQATASLCQRGNLSIETTDANNRVAGRGGYFYGIANAGQSVAALPLYGTGKLLGVALGDGAGARWRDLLAGPRIEENEHKRWGGQIEIFFVNLFNAFATALLCALFFLFSLRTGASARYSIAATLLLGLTTYIAPLSGGFFQHSSEALLTFIAFYFLFRDAEEPDVRKRIAAGAVIVLMVQFRFASAVAIPALLGFHGWIVWRRNRPSTSRAFAEATPLLASTALAFAAHAAVQYLKFGTIWFTGNYDKVRFDASLFTSLRGFLISPGQSIVLFTPLLVLTPWTFRTFIRRFPAASVFVLAEAAICLIAFGKNHYWHGMWHFGPRYLSPLVPLLMLPLALWMQERGRRVWSVIAPLALAGLWIQLIHIFVNFWYVALHERYLEARPEWNFLFDLKSSQVVAHSRALLAGDSRVDMWLINVWRMGGAGPALAFAIPLIGLAALAGWKAFNGAAEMDSPNDARGSAPWPFRLRYLAYATALVIAVTLTAAGIDRLGFTSDSDEALMKEGLESLYTRKDAPAAEIAFRKVLARHPAHYGATFQLARTLDAEGRPAEAVPFWSRTLMMAESYRDQQTAATAFGRLEHESTLDDDALIALALHVRYNLNDPVRSVSMFQQVLVRSPAHYGATYQLASALDAAGSPAAARLMWERMLFLANAVHDEGTASTVRERMKQVDR